jgi:hypothetical protein
MDQLKELENNKQRQTVWRDCISCIVN